MSHFSRTRSALARTVAVGALSLVAGGLLVACGDDDSSATGSPTTTSAASPTTTTKTAVKSGTPQASEAPATPDQDSDAEAEQPQAVPSGFPGPTEVPVSPRAQAYLDGLKREGITPAADGIIAVSTADYICAAKEQGSSQQEITTFVTAAVGSEASAAGQELTSEQAGKNAEVYIRVAQAEYCK
ncbi:DUF732 domain-containing protein [Prescottella agglutinans]|uniref:DUF732 domain-containing protein n=1 Tax=Prescottella agglutinans TaxID=1644129 RepID=UPI003D98E169